MKSVLLVADHVKGKVKSATFNTLTFAHQVSKSLDAKLCLLVVGNNVQEIEINDGYQDILDYWGGNTAKPTEADAYESLMQIAESLNRNTHVVEEAGKLEMSNLGVGPQ